MQSIAINHIHTYAMHIIAAHILHLILRLPFIYAHTKYAPYSFLIKLNVDIGCEEFRMAVYLFQYCVCIQLLRHTRTTHINSI